MLFIRITTLYFYPTPSLSHTPLYLSLTPLYLSLSLSFSISLSVCLSLSVSVCDPFYLIYVYFPLQRGRPDANVVTIIGHTTF